MGDNPIGDSEIDRLAASPLGRRLGVLDREEGPRDPEPPEFEDGGIPF